MAQEEKSRAIEVLATWVAEDCRPFSAVSGSGFRKMAQYFIRLGSQYGESINIEDLIPNPTTISRRIQNLAEEEKNLIKPDIQTIISSGNASATIDMWTDNFVKRNFLCATLHFHRDYDVKNLTLGIKSMDLDRSTGINIKFKLLALFEEFGVFGLDKIKFVTDRGSNVKKALSDETRLNCSNHLLSNILDAAFDGCSEISMVLDACKGLVKYLKKGNLQQLLPTSLKNHCPTRWNSYLNLFKSIADNWSEINKILNDKGEIQRLSEVDYAIIKALYSFCKDIDTISRKVQGCSSPTICYVLPSIKRLKMICQTTQHDMQLISTLKQQILNGVEIIWVKNISIWHKAASFLFPPTNDDLSEDDLSEVTTFCKELILNTAADDITTPVNTIASPEVEFSEEIQFFFPDKVRRSTATATDSAIDEIERYSRDSVEIEENFNVLKWWEQNSKRFPRLSKIAISILTIPASSAASERVFSLAGNIITEKRNRLAPKTINDVIFLHLVLSSYN